LCHWFYAVRIAGTVIVHSLSSTEERNQVSDNQYADLSVLHVKANATFSTTDL
jgi:hypothetical protein